MGDCVAFNLYQKVEIHFHQFEKSLTLPTFYERHNDQKYFVLLKAMFNKYGIEPFIKSIERIKITLVVIKQVVAQLYVVVKLINLEIIIKN